jgi:quercetin dioxygenase-like cupin family protein
MTLALVALGLAAACARPAPRLVVGSLARDLDAFLADHPLGAGQTIRADGAGRSAGASYHVVQVRGREQPHRHAAHDLAVLLLRGAGTLTLGDERVRLRAGDAAVVPRGVAHWFASDGREAAVAFAVYTPPLDAPDVVPVDSTAGDE